jgi:hypothetical protein
VDDGADSEDLGQDPENPMRLTKDQREALVELDEHPVGTITKTASSPGGGGVGARTALALLARGYAQFDRRLNRWDEGRSNGWEKYRKKPSLFYGLYITITDAGRLALDTETRRTR